MHDFLDSEIENYVFARGILDIGRRHRADFERSRNVSVVLHATVVELRTAEASGAGASLVSEARAIHDQHIASGSSQVPRASSTPSEPLEPSWPVHSTATSQLPPSEELNT